MLLLKFFLLVLLFDAFVSGLMRLCGMGGEGLFILVDL
jgi:hypothetical protein